MKFVKKREEHSMKKMKKDPFSVLLQEKMNALPVVVKKEMRAK